MKTRFTYLLTFVFALLAPLVFAQAQTMQISGTVSDEDGVPIPGVNITVEGTTMGTSSDFNGDYSIAVEQGQVLSFESIGFKEQKITVGTDSTINVQLEMGTALDEVIVVGYGQTTKQAYTGSAVTVDSDAISSKNVASVTKALEGEVSGVSIINTSGQPGEEPTIRIRGFGSVNGNRDPLIVLDGVPFSGKLSSIDPNDIKNMTVLKDATATAIYGSRGANGVILVDTKKGKSGTSQISASFKTGVNFRLLPQYQTIKSPEEFLEVAYDSWAVRGKLSGQDPDAFAQNYLFSANGIDPKYNMWGADVADLIDPATGKFRSGVSRLYSPENWEDYAFQSSQRNEANVNFSGGENKTHYYASLGYLDDKGYSINSDFSRYSMRLNLDQEINDWLDGTLNLGYSVSKSNNNGQSEDSGSVFWFTDNIPSIYPLFERDEDGNKIPEPIYGGYMYDYGEGRAFGGLTNAIADAHYGMDRSRSNEVNMSNTFTAHIVEGLTAETRFGLQYQNTARDVLGNPFYGSSASQNGSIFKTKTDVFSYNFLQLLRYKKDFGLHNIEAFAAHEITSYRRNYMNGSKSNIVVPDLPEFNNAVVSSPSNSYTRDYALESYFGQVNYNYDDKYYVSGTIRRDGSSRFAKGNKWGTFGSVGLGWIVTEESFMDNVDWLSYLKLKASYGLTGQQAGLDDPSRVGLTYYPYLDMYDVKNLNGEISLSFNSKGNPNITWEKAKMAQIGLEFSLGDYLDATVDYYVKNTTNLLFDRREPPSKGYAIVYVNDGQLRNTGLEFDLTAHLVKTSDFYLDLKANGSFLTNKLKKMPIDPVTGAPKDLDISSYYGRSKGHSLYDFYIREWAGVNDEGAGMWNRYYDKATDETILSLADYKKENPSADIGVETTTDYQDATRKYVGKSAIPDLLGGFGINTGYKGFDLSINFTYGLGGYGYDFVYGRLMDNDFPGGNNWHKDILNRWQEGVNENTDIPRLSAALDENVDGTSTRFLIKKSFLNLSNTRLGYTFPNNTLKSIGVSRLNVFVSGSNLLLLSGRKGYNPSTSEAGASDWYTYSPLSTVTGGLSVTF